MTAMEHSREEDNIFLQQPFGRILTSYGFLSKTKKKKKIKQLLKIRYYRTSERVVSFDLNLNLQIFLLFEKKFPKKMGIKINQ